MKKDTNIEHRRHFENVTSFIKRGGIIGVYQVPQEFKPVYLENPVFPKGYPILVGDDIGYLCSMLGG